MAGELTVRATHLELRRLTLDDLELPREADHVTLRNVHNHGFWIEGASNITFVGGEVSCGRCPFHPFLIDGGAPDFRPPSNIVFDGVSFHDWHTADAGPAHRVPADPGRATGSRSATPSSANCGTADGGRGATANLHVSWLGRGPKTRNVLIENNFFYASGTLRDQRRRLAQHSTSATTRSSARS